MLRHRVPSARWACIQREVLKLVRLARKAEATVIVIQRHHVLLVGLVSTRVLSGQTAQHVWLVGPILTAILRRCVIFVAWASTLVLVRLFAHLVLLDSTTTTAMRAHRV